MQPPMEHLGYQVTQELSQEAYERDKAELLAAFNPRYVCITEEQTPAGCLGLLKVTVNTKSYILTCADDTDPKPVDKPYFYIKVFNDYPAIAPKVFFPPNRRLAHVNTFRNGTQCIDEWKRYSSLKSIAEKTIRAIIYDENVTKYNDMACSSVQAWQKSMAAKKAFPMLQPPDLILNTKTASVSTVAKPTTPPPLPGRPPAVALTRAPSPPPLPPRR